MGISFYSTQHQLKPQLPLCGINFTFKSLRRELGGESAPRVFWKCYDGFGCRWWQRGALVFGILGSQMRGSWETSPLKGRAGLDLLLELLCAKSVATSWCHTLSNAFLKCGFFSFTGCTSVWMRWESWALKSTPQKSSKWRETWSEPLTYSSHSE